MFAPNEVEITNNHELRIANLTGQVAMFIYCGPDNNRRHIIGVKLTPSGAGFDIVTLTAMTQLARIHGPILKMRLILPGNHDLTSAWWPAFLTGLSTLLEVPGFDIDLYTHNNATASSLGSSLSLTANLFDFELVPQWS